MGYDGSKCDVFFGNFDGAVDVSRGNSSMIRLRILFVDVVNEFVDFDFEAVNINPSYFCELFA